jgi:ribosome-associated toxin RatA of RatAB toxin-antitoxin module
LVSVESSINFGVSTIFKDNGSTRKTAGDLPAAFALAACIATFLGAPLSAKTIESAPPETFSTISHESTKFNHAHDAEANKTRRIASELPVSVPLVSTQDPLPKPSKKCVVSVMETTIKAPIDFVWQELTDFPSYPSLFPRIESCKVTKRTGNYVYTESNLKPQMFLHESKQRTVNDLNGKPYVLRWAVLEGNFESSQGRWELASDNNGKACKVKYTLESTTDPIPKAVAVFTLKIIQKDIVKTFKRTTEHLYESRQANAGGNIAANTP